MSLLLNLNMEKIWTNTRVSVWKRLPDIKVIDTDQIWKVMETYTISKVMEIDFLKIKS